jgi:hypothetical protein
VHVEQDCAEVFAKDFTILTRKILIGTHSRNEIHDGVKIVGPIVDAPGATFRGL